LNQQFTGKLNIIGQYHFGTDIFYGFSGTYTTQNWKTSALFLRSTNDFDFSPYTCGFVINEQKSWDTTYYPTVSAADTTMTNFVGGVVTTGTLTGVTGVNYPRSSWPLIFEAFTVSLRTISFDYNNLGDTKNGIEPLPNFYKYPETSVKCSMYEVLDTYQL
jgi:hypothetical protein